MSKIADFQNELNSRLNKVEVTLVAGWTINGDFPDSMDITHRETGKMLAAGETDQQLGTFFAYSLVGGQMLKFNNRDDALAYFDREANLLAEEDN